ncbi:MAG: hypothetical protein J0L92_10960 [Deltaproteobacteria bacterium]|nr:hypothetical protein [Deltaproteobacteria bacterium]
MTSAYRDDAAPHCTRCTARLDVVHFGDEGESLCVYCAKRLQLQRDERAARVPMLTEPQVLLVALACIALLFATVVYVYWRSIGGRWTDDHPDCGQEICS